MYWKRLLIRSSLALTIPILLFSMLLPTGLRLGLIELLKRQGAEEALIENVDLNLFAGSLALEGLHLRFPDAEPFKLGRLRANLDMGRLIDGEIVVETLSLDGLRAQIDRDENGRITVNGWSPDSLPASKTDPAQESGAPPAFAIESLKLRNLQLLYREPGFSQPLLLRSLQFGPLRSTEPETPSRLELDLALQQPARLKGKLSLAPLADSPQLSGRLSLAALPLDDYRKFYRPHLDRLAGRVDLALDLDLRLPQGDPQAVTGSIAQDLRIGSQKLSRANLEQNLESLAWNGDSQLEGLARIAFQGQLKLNGLNLSYRDLEQSLQTLDWEGSGQFDEQTAVALQGQLRLGTLKLNYRDLEQSLQAFEWQGKTRLDSQARLSLQGKLQLIDSRTRDARQDAGLARFRQLDIEGIELEPDQSIGIGQLRLADLDLLSREGEPALLKLAQLTLQDLQRSAGNDLTIATVSLAEPVLQVEIDSNRRLPALDRLQDTLDRLSPSADSSPASPDSPTSKTDKPAAESPAELTVSLLQLTRPGQIDLIDRSVKPEFKTRLLLEALEVRNLSRNSPARFELKARQGDYNRIEIEGNGLLLQPRQQLELEAFIEQLDLPPLTSYTSKAIGYGVKSGVLDSRIKLTIDKRQLDALIKLDLDAIDVIETDPETAAELNSAAGISIDLALSTLKDGDGLIRLEIPVKGDLDKPDFKLQKVVNKALGKAMQGATLAYLKHTLQPFGSLITLYKLAKSASQRVALPSVAFEPGTAQLAKDQEKLLNKVAKLMKERPALKIKACGLAVASDRDVLLEQWKTQQKKTGDKPAKKEPSEEMIQQQLFDLAEQRARLVKKRLVTAGISPGQIINCLVKVTKHRKDRPIVQLLL